MGRDSSSVGWPFTSRSLNEVIGCGTPSSRISKSSAVRLVTGLPPPSMTVASTRTTFVPLRMVGGGCCESGGCQPCAATVASTPDAKATRDPRMPMAVIVTAMVALRGSLCLSSRRRGGSPARQGCPPPPVAEAAARTPFWRLRQMLTGLGALLGCQHLSDLALQGDVPRDRLGRRLRDLFLERGDLLLVGHVREQ